MLARSENVTDAMAAMRWGLSVARFVNSERIGCLKVWSFAIAKARQGEELAVPRCRRRSLAVQVCYGLRHTRVCATVPGSGVCASRGQGRRHGASRPCTWPPVPIAAAAAGKEGSALLVDGALHRQFVVALNQLGGPQGEPSSDTKFTIFLDNFGPPRC